MEILPAAQPAPSTAPAPAASTATAITSDFDMFLQLLTTQMRNQDPLNPADSTEYTAQLATFSGVEQQVQTNDLLRDLQSAFAAMNMGQLSGWIGMEARAEMPVNFTGQAITLQAFPASLADRAELIIRNLNGDIVARSPMPLTEDPVIWDGRDASGQPVPHGTYSLSVQSWRGEDLLEERAAFVYGEVTEAQTVQGDVWVTLANGISIPADDVQGLRRPPQ